MKEIKNKNIEDLLIILQKIKDIVIEESIEDNKSLKEKIKHVLYKTVTKKYLVKSIEKQNHINSVIFELIASLYREVLILRRQISESGSPSYDAKSFFNESYFVGGLKSPYVNYDLCKKDVKKFAKIIKKYFSPKKLLEIGCAYGFLPKYMRAKKVQAYGIDISKFAIKKGNKPYLMVGDAKNLKQFKTSEFDVVVCSEVLEHIEKKDIQKVLHELFRVSSKWLILTINSDSNDYYLDLSHISIFPRSYWEELFDHLKMKRDIEKEREIRKNNTIKELGHNNEIFIFRKN